MSIRVCTLILCTFLLFGCSTWKTVGGPYKITSQNFEVVLPSGWKQVSAKTKEVWITRDGTALQLIRVSRLASEKELTNTKKTLTNQMLPQEVSEAILDELRSVPGATNYELIENSPATIDNAGGFKLSYSFRTATHLLYQALCYGFMEGKGVYLIQYEAPRRYYFELDRGTFEAVRESFHRLKKD